MIRRRNFIKVLGAASAGMAAMHIDPLVRTLRAQSTNPPKRLVVFFSPLGAIRDMWFPTGSETSFTMNETLQPLESLKSELIICKGLNQPGDFGGANHAEMPGILTGLRIKDGGHPNISVDQFIAENPKIHQGTTFRSIALAAWGRTYERRKDSGQYLYMSALGPKQAVIPEGIPQYAFDRIFDGFTANADPNGAPDPRRVKRKSVLDAVAKELGSRKRHLGVNQEESAKIDQHLTSVRELEKSLLSVAGSGVGAGCSVPSRPDEFGIADDTTLNLRFRAQIDIAVAALACDRTRVVTLTGEGGRSDSRHPWIGVNDYFHAISHSPDYQGHAAICRWYAEEFRYLLERLQSIPEGNGSMLDNTCVAWVSEQGCRTPQNEHSRVDVPYILAGNCQGYFRTGRFIDFGGISMNSFLISIMNAMGIEGNTFGMVSAPPLPNVT